MNLDVALVRPEAIVAGGLLVCLLVDLFLPAGKKQVTCWISVLACVLATVSAAFGTRGVVGTMLAIDGIATLARPAILAATALVLAAGAGQRGRDDDHGAWAASVLGLGLGALVVASASSLVTLFLGHELMSLAGYALAAWRGGDRRAAEAGMKFVLFGGLASGLMLFGMSHVYGLTGHLDFAGIGQTLAQGMPLPVIAALCLAAVGIAYKLTVLPFHFYAPDVYEGAPALAVAAVGVAPKVASAAALARGIALCVPGTLVPPVALGGALAAVGVASVLFAAFTAIAQKDAKRIVAFSAIGHAGTVLLALACLPGTDSLAAAAFYLAAYAVANVGALACLAVLERERGTCRLDALAGAMRARPWLTAALCMFLFSLAGVPPLGGFLAKWGVLREALRVGLAGDSRAYMAWAALALLVSTAISAWSYLLIVRAAVLAPAGDDSGAARPRLAWGTVAVPALCAAATVGLGLWLNGFAALARVLAG